MTRAQWLQLRPQLLEENRQALDVWDFCRGWDPVLIPYAAEFYVVRDLDMLMIQLQVIRSTVDKFHAAQRAAEK